MTNEPTPEEIERVALEIMHAAFDRGNSDIFSIVAKWHLTQLAQVTKERDNAIRQLIEVTDAKDSLLEAVKFYERNK